MALVLAKSALITHNPLTSANCINDNFSPKILACLRCFPIPTDSYLIFADTKKANREIPISRLWDPPEKKIFFCYAVRNLR